MPANLSPEYKQAEQAFRRAREPREPLESLTEMLRAIPKHKGTEHLQADIKSRIKELTDELSGPRKTGHKSPSHTVQPRGRGAGVPDRSAERRKIELARAIDRFPDQTMRWRMATSWNARVR